MYFPDLLEARPLDPLDPRLESGTANPTVATVNKVANALGKQLKLVSPRQKD